MNRADAPLAWMLTLPALAIVSRMPTESMREAHSTKTRNAIPSAVEKLVVRRAHRLRKL